MWLILDLHRLKQKCAVPHRNDDAFAGMDLTDTRVRLGGPDDNPRAIVKSEGSVYGRATALTTLGIRQVGCCQIVKLSSGS